MPTPNRLAGYALRHEGRVLDASGTLGNGPGKGRCSCGQESPKVGTTSRRKRWHRDHKDDLRAGGTGVVWDGGLS